MYLLAAGNRTYLSMKNAESLEISWSEWPVFEQPVSSSSVVADCDRHTSSSPS